MTQQKNKLIDSAIAEAGAYEVIRKRLEEQGRSLAQFSQNLNEKRLSEFGNIEMQTIDRCRVNTQQNCIARDIVQVGEKLLFGYNVFIGLKKETQIQDVFALFELAENDGKYELVQLDHDDSFLSDSRFVSDFEELYRYYKNARLVKLLFKDSKLLASFQFTDRADGIRVFRWNVSSDASEISYIDNRGERDIDSPKRYDFEWVETSRDDFIHGKYPHVNIADTVFVEATGGDLTVKIENNTEVGLGVYSEPVEHENQSLDDANISYAQVGNLLLLAITPYKEDSPRYLIYNVITESVTRIDAIGDSCIQLPEDQGVIFPGGYYLENGQHKTFPDNIKGLTFEHMHRSPNGEDVLYVFYEAIEGMVALFSYNLITKTLQNPIYANGYALYDDGKLIVFSANEQASRVHPMQIWQTSYISSEFASQQEPSATQLGKIGNSELVRGVSELYTICHLIDKEEVTLRHYQELSSCSKNIFDRYYWLEAVNGGEIANELKLISDTSELVIDEFEKVKSIQDQSSKAVHSAQAQQQKLLSTISTTTWENTEQFVDAITALRKQRGHIATIKEYRYIDVEKLESFDQALLETEGELGKKTVAFLATEHAFNHYQNRLVEIEDDIKNVNTNAQLKPIIEKIEKSTAGLDLLSELISTLNIDDATIRTNIVESISQIYANLNQSKARATQTQKGLGSQEAVAQFAAQFKLFSQSITNSLGISNTPEKCDEQLAKLLIQLEDLESQFSDYDQFLSDIMDKREELYESFETHKQSLIEAQQRRAQTLNDSAQRILNSIEKRTKKLLSTDELNTYFASDTLVLKIRDISEKLIALNAQVFADDIQASFKALKEQAIRSLRDKTEIYEDGGKIIKLGPKHKFSVNTQELDLTIIPRNDQLYFHLIGTDYYELITDSRLAESQQFWSMSIESETDTIYRSEYLAHLVLQAAQNGTTDLNTITLNEACDDFDKLTKLVRDFSTPLYKQGYQKGIHDHDAALILQKLLPTLGKADLLKFEPLARGIAQLFLIHNETHEDIQAWVQQAKSAKQLQALFSDNKTIELLTHQIQLSLQSYFEQHSLEISNSIVLRSSQYLLEQLAQNDNVIQSQYAADLINKFEKILDKQSSAEFHKSLNQLSNDPSRQWQVCYAWLDAFAKAQSLNELAHYIPEATANILASLTSSNNKLDYKTINVELELTIEGLIGEHKKIQSQSLTFSLDDFLGRMHQHQHQTLVHYHDYLAIRSDVMQHEKSKLKLDSFKPRPLSSFVRNRLINESYLPLIGDNLAKQMGAAGKNKRTDLMGLLMMISPPGYGKTTLMEYVANRLGLIFVKINCPALGHDVLSLDPEQAPNSTAKQELEKINLAFEMGSNVMLYLDDIQHTNPEFLQKYISLCDGTRRVEGVWKGQTKTYDMRGKKFCVVMAGNPYTESGEVFKVPDMLANRADIYNLGDILSGMDEQFALSYIENALTSNAVLAPLATREMHDVYTLIDIAKGKNRTASELRHQYSAAEVNEITNIFKKLFTIQELVLKINSQYIASAAQADQYRMEPSFKLQGSYRNMNKMAEKISGVMNDNELIQLLDDHYLGEAQLLTNGTEENLLKLAQLRGTLNTEQEQRWEQIKQDFLRNKSLGGNDAGDKIATQLFDLVNNIQQLHSSFSTVNQASHEANENQLSQDKALIEQSEKLQNKRFQKLTDALAALGSSLQTHESPNIEVINQPLPEISLVLESLSKSLESGIMPLIVSMEKKLDIDLNTLHKIQALSDKVDKLKVNTLKQKTAKRSTKQTDDPMKPSSDKKRF